MYPPINITLSLAKYPTSFFCLRCKCPMFKHLDGAIVSTTPNAKIVVPGLGICPNVKCQQSYTFTGFLHNIAGANKNVVVSLHNYPQEVSMQFHCYECRTKIFQFEGDVMDVQPGKITGTPIMVVSCPDSRCGIKFAVYDY